MTTRHLRGAAIAAAAVLALSGCTSGGSGPKTTPEPTLSPLAMWAGKMCVAAQQIKLTTPPSVSQNDPKNYVTLVPRWLEQTVTTMKKGAKDLQALPPAPGGVAAVNMKNAIASVNVYATSMQKAADTISVVDKADKKGLDKAIAGLGDYFQKLNVTNPSPIDELSKVPAMADAIRQAPTCRTIAPPAASPS